MRSIKPGRGPSMMGGIYSLGIAVFGIIWTIIAVGNGGGLFAAFGIVFIVMSIVMAIYNFKNATSKNRYSSFDITENGEEVDPLNERFGEVGGFNTSNSKLGPINGGFDEKTETGSFCPYCGRKAESDFDFCNYCGKKLPGRNEG